MLLYLCDNCGCPVAADIARLHQEQGKNAALLCKECTRTKTASGEFICDRCGNRFADQAIRAGEALVIVGTAQTPGAIYCKRCRKFYRRQGQAKDIRNLVLLFLLPLTIPLVVALFRHFDRPDASLPPPLPVQEIVRQVNSMVRQQLQEFESKLEKKSLPRQATVALPQRETAPAKAQQYLDEIPQLLARKAIEKCVIKLQKGDTTEKLAAIQEIARYKERVATKYLLDALDDSHPLVRSFSAYALGILGEQQAITKLFRILEDREPMVRQAVTQALTLITRERFVFFKDLSPDEWEKLKKMKDASKK